MDRQGNIHNISPVCRFGPGGDFVNNWPGNAEQYLKKSQNPISKLLCSISKIIDTMQEQSDSVVTIDNTSDPYQEKALDNATNNEFTNTQTVTTAPDGCDVEGQKLLFTDDSRTSPTVEHKPKHRVRTHRRTAKKRPALRIAGQGSLFEAHAQSA